MKAIIRLALLFGALMFILVAVIKHVQKCSWKEAAGIVEELCNELKGFCPLG